MSDKYGQQQTMFETEGPATRDSGPVTCLGMTFENDEARRAHFTEELRKKLQDPEFRKIEGFPIGSDEDILNLSDPPYYTACPNPWIADFIAEWEAQKPEQPAGNHYHREPFATDVSEGKNDPIYNAHSYHTKVPHKAIMRYILHYTQPGDIVFDGFCGTGMTGVAAQMCGEREVVMSLGYQVKPDGTILREEMDEDGKKVWRPFSKLGVRRAVLNDLSPAATFIAYNYNTPVDVAAFEKEAKRILKEVEKECGWMYETLHTDGKTKGKINYTVWSDVFVCPECANEVIFWNEALDSNAGKVRDEFPCPKCTAVLTKRNMERAWVTKFDAKIGEPIRQTKQAPVLISYTVNGKKAQKKPDQSDHLLLDKIENSEIPYWFPSEKMMFKGEGWGDTWRAGVHAGITHVHHFYTKRNLWVLAACWNRLFKAGARFPFLFTASQRALSRMASIAFSYFFHGGGGFVNAGTKGTLYVSSTNPEVSVFHSLRSRLSSLRFSFDSAKQNFCTENKSATCKSSIMDESIDYVFIDPPFGSNIMYSELNFLWEPWLKVWTNIADEAIESKSQEKSLNEYRELMTSSFREAYRVLKPGRWMTVEFSNTKASVWNNIQTAITEAGFVVANVSALDKKQGSFKAYTTPTAVKQDLVISAYKPNGGFEERFQKEAQTEEGVWDFVRTHLKYLPITKQQGALLQFVPERDPRILFDQMVAYYVRKGYPVPISSQEFQIGLSQRFIERDGMFFLPDQVAEYDRKKMTSGELKQMTMFVSDEASAIQWLRQLIKEKPQTFSDINPQFMQQLGGWSKNEAQLDLRELLNQNFLSYDGKGPVPEQIHAYLSTNWKDLRNLPKDDPTLVAKARDRWYVPDPNKAGDLEKLREKALLKEFEEYKEVKKKLKVFRLEAVRAGFKKAWQERDYAVIVAVADKIPNNVLEEDPKLLMWYDQAVTRMGGE
ncbi:site-specific DNA-methyltransferase [Desulfovibrio desulfuricans]|uniref:DNA methyltransferase n=1 Tax=Desulfovibrio desulfuricans TaxID=876 RepID=UPI001D06F0F4|nr:DNA methyltransferase [Desulfovibrio desulfuricans]MCB6543576.1 site-specific DNA-methyltransferase [Desulfovibrio desulfuricans]MCB6554657.1 site-specific DNA-methyltransferase [Desulfovibrio desulfuricans]MCB6566513.1 site-specific DNA-methyltransferase [Desulfovibrio desulfuricans]MCB7347695.1 site-specific DNA-methyltransferase [Desulfovibrio desulfuricans]MCQ5218959.1 site-specific DNA-methyltransferase [Desulfovibrio desulfuricans]